MSNEELQAVASKALLLHPRTSNREPPPEDTEEFLSLLFKQDTLAHQVGQNFPFDLTRSQKEVLREFIEDFHSKVESHGSMCRLLQGDVGSGARHVPPLP